jgi:tetratricopeptide (TPR) repeat protein
MVATSYFNAGREEEADPWYDRCLAIREKVLDPHDRLLAVIQTKIGRNRLRVRDFAASHAHFDNAVEIFDYIIAHKDFDTPGPYPYYYGAMLMEQSRLFLAEGDLEKALVQSRFADEVMIAGGETGRSDRHYTLVDMGTIQSLLGNFDAAEDLLRQAAALDEELLDPKCTAAIETKEAIADNCLRRGDRETARQLYSDLELELEKDFGPDYDKVVELRDKRTAIQ